MRCGLLGRKLGHSYSPKIHGLLADYTYTLFEKEPQELEGFLRSGDWDGLNVTMPYKKSVIPFCDLLAPLARELGSVNTLVRLADGRILGENTDAWGFDQMLGRVGVDCRGKQALVLGSGGASATVQAVLRLAGAEVTVISRSGENTYETLHRHGDAAILVNATPVGMYPHNGEAPVELDRLPKLEAVLDVVYNPVRTRLILDAMERGIPCESGLYMLVAQAVRACEMWTGRTIPREKSEAVWRQVAGETENIILIGMPGCGKSTVGRALAEKLGRTFVDADGAITEKIGDIPKFFEAYGEADFRKEETAVLAELGKQSGLVIATGGGCVTRRENHDLLRQNGRIIWLRRPPGQLPADGRPVSLKRGIAALYEERKHLYEQFADQIVENTTVEETIQKLTMDN